MRGLVVRWVVTAFALWLTSQLVSGIELHGAGAVFIAALVLGVLNACLRPLVLFFTLPINLLTLGLFTLVVNGLMLWLTSGVVRGFEVHGFWSAVGGALLLSLISFVLNVFVSDSGRIEYIYVERIEH
ncbi:MAG: phage holin family protein [Deltaproteobacteria bacterium]|nr:phage holin family protein [Deltaproteobacteria bacterium]